MSKLNYCVLLIVVIITSSCQNDLERLIEGKWVDGSKTLQFESGNCIMNDSLYPTYILSQKDSVLFFSHPKQTFSNYKVWKLTEDSLVLQELLWRINITTWVKEME